MFARATRGRSGVWRKRLAQWGLIVLVWTMIGLFFTGQFYFSMWRNERPIPLTEALATQFSFVYIWALVTPLAVWLVRRFPIEQERWARRVAGHVLCSTLFVIVVGCLLYAFNYFYFLQPSGRTHEFGRLVRNVIANASENYGIYGLILLSLHSVRYYQRYREGELKAAQLQTQLAQAQLQALRMQLHPHFLFNTLHSISSLIHQDPEAADKMIARLGDFLRLTLENSGTPEVTLKQELEFLKCYLEIQRIRFYDRLTTHLDIDPRALNTRVPNLILQPIVENAIRHGIAPRSTPGHIQILAEQKNGTLRLEVTDNGPGLRPNQNPRQGFREGLGLANTQARLAQLYGSNFCFELANHPAGGLVVRMLIPASPGINDEV